MSTATRKSVPSRRTQLDPPDLDRLRALRSDHHARCLACTHPHFRLDFGLDGDGGLAADLEPGANLCSYEGVMHGGVVALLADEAMTCCLMAHGVVAVTGDLEVRYLVPVAAGEPVRVRSRVVRACRPLFHIEATLSQAGVTKVRAKGRFLPREKVDAP